MNDMHPVSQEPTEDAAPQDGDVAQLPDWARKALERANAQAARARVEAKELRTKVDTLSPAAQRLSELEDAQKSETDKLAEQLRKLQAEREQAAQDAARARAEASLVRLAAKAGVDPDLATLLDVSKLDLDDEDAVIATLRKFAPARATGGGASNPTGDSVTQSQTDAILDRLLNGGRKSTLFGG